MGALRRRPRERFVYSPAMGSEHERAVPAAERTGGADTSSLRSSVPRRTTSAAGAGQLEAQVYGKVDLAVDVAAIFVAPYTPKNVKKNADSSCKKHGIGFEAIEPDDPGLVNAELKGLGPTTVKNALG